MKFSSPSPERKNHHHGEREKERDQRQIHLVTSVGPIPSATSSRTSAKHKQSSSRVETARG